MITRSRHSRGQVLVLAAVFIAVLICAAALAIDIGRAYGVRARLNAAVDAASFEATRALGQGSDTAKANEVASAYFWANYPSEYLGAIPGDPLVHAQHDENTGTWNVSVEATAAMSTVFATFAGFRSLNIRANSESQRRPLDIVLVLDTSISLSEVFGEVKKNAQSYVNLFNESDDRFGLVAFSNSASPLVSVCGQLNPPYSPAVDQRCPRGFSKNRVTGQISDLVTVENTNSEEGMKQAMDQLNSLAPEVRSSTRAIVFFSDGSPNTINGRFAMTSGGVINGNLYSEITRSNPPWRPVRPRRIFNPLRYNGEQINGNGNDPILPLPESGTDVSGTVPFESYNHIRSFTGGTSDDEVQCDVNRAARNMVENVANQARNQGIIIFTLGLGKKLKEELELTWCGYQNQEYGENILKRLANSIDSDTYNKAQPTGEYCYAKSTQELRTCFDKIASKVLRITK